jgi:septal ring factor EnvC (AmiA/AmiB activator)
MMKISQPLDNVILINSGAQTPSAKPERGGVATANANAAKNTQSASVAVTVSTAARSLAAVGRSDTADVDMDKVNAVRAAILMRAVTPELHSRAKGFSAEVQEIARVRRETAAASEALFTAESDIADRRGKIEALLQEKAALEQAVTADAQLASEDLKKLAARAKSLRELLQGLPRQGSSSAKAEPQGQTAGPAIRNTSFINPSAGTLIRRFGQTAPRTGAAGGGRSEGWTWRTDKGASVRAPIQGTVEYAGPLKGWGMVLILRLGGGYHLVLAGMDQTTAEAGRTLSAGEPVGRMSDQDRPTPELYMEIRRDGSPVDPARWLASLRAPG